MSEINNPNEIFINDLCKKVPIIENIFRKGEIEKTLNDFENELLLNNDINNENEIEIKIKNWRENFKLSNIKINEIIKLFKDENYKNNSEIQQEIKKKLKSIIEFIMKNIDESIINHLIPQLIKSILLYIGFIRIVLFSSTSTTTTMTMTDANKEIEIKDLHETIKESINFISNNIKSLQTKEQYYYLNGIDLILKSDISIYPLDYQLIIEKPFLSKSQCEGCIGDLETEYYPEVLLPISNNSIIFRVDGQSIRQSPISEHALGRIYTFKLEPITNCFGQFLSNQLSLKVKLANASTAFKNKPISIRVFSILHYDEKEMQNNNNNNDNNNYNYEIQLGNNFDTVKIISDVDHEFNIINDHSYNLIKSLNIKKPFRCGYSDTTIGFSKDLGTDPILNIRHKLQKPTSTLTTDISGRILFVEIFVKQPIKID
ncbi:hypothetical protein ACTFIW_004201 [Dictyostelium discoideum]